MKNFYVLRDRKTGWVYGNYSSNPEESIKTHIRRARNPSSRDYNKPFHTALRERPEDFDFEYLEERPSYIEFLHHYGPPAKQ